MFLMDFVFCIQNKMKKEVLNLIFTFKKFNLHN